ncbi:MAG: nucleotidyltransferase [Rhodovulum sulfidophilum]|uniref:Nucleotidyltransferase n=1 Tax=Rhodovulum sulfidophilum TaxID=35806 RepID=A0A2W5N1E9_RHOSU|nr:MAG: nucleotidyltransferase [Rhodovulum sulfidophilum]
MPSDRIRRNAGSPETPFALVEKRRGATRLAACDARALRLGLAPGLSLADARARVPELAALPHDPAADLRWLGAIADFCDRYSPMVALDPPDGLTLDITGCAHLFGSEAEMARETEARLGALGLATRAARAATPEAAWALARYSREETEAAIPRLPIAALRLDPEAEVALTRAGLRTIGALAARPTAPLTARFGAAVTARLDRLLGREASRITPRRPVPELVRDRRFAEPIGRVSDALAVIDALTRDAAAELARRGMGGRRFEAAFYRGDGDIRRIAVETGAPCRDPALVARLFATRIEALADPLDPGFGFDAIRLAIPRLDPLAARQIGLDGAEPGEPAVAELVDRLSARFGVERLRRFAPRDSHLPERAARSQPAIAPAAAEAWPLPGDSTPPLRPLGLLARPEPITVTVESPDGAPRVFHWAGQRHAIARREGPERIAAEWWRAPGDIAPQRDYYRVEDEGGRRFWIYRESPAEPEGAAPPPRWFLHGFFA